jgi:hypothetical protein
MTSEAAFARTSSSGPRFWGAEGHVEAGHRRALAYAEPAERLARERVGQLREHAVQHLWRDEVALFHRAWGDPQAVEATAEEPPRWGARRRVVAGRVSTLADLASDGVDQVRPGVPAHL